MERPGFNEIEIGPSWCSSRAFAAERHDGPIGFNSRRLHRKPQRRLGFSSFVHVLRSGSSLSWAHFARELPRPHPGPRRCVRNGLSSGYER
jgi:hypothetical protein